MHNIARIIFILSFILTPIAPESRATVPNLGNRNKYRDALTEEENFLSQNDYYEKSTYKGNYKILIIAVLQ